MNKENYPSWLVPIEIARELKKIGFNEPCLYYNSEAISGMGYQCIEIEERIHNEAPNVIELRELKYFNYNKTKGCISIPAWEQVFKWFREHNLHSEIWYKIEHYEEDGEVKEAPPLNSEYYFWFYEDARQALVEELIVIYKQKNIIP